MDDRIYDGAMDLVGRTPLVRLKRLSPPRGAEICAKTGSADIAVAKEGEGNQVRKHTWVSGWLPREDPKVAFVVFCHDVAVTSSHSAVYVARQFLLQPETVAWLRARGVTIGVDAPAPSPEEPR